MEHNSRMKEITGNLKQDVKDLLGESVSLFTGFFKRGVCTVRAVADKWKAFAHDISAAVDDLMKPPFAEGGPEAPDASLDPEGEPIVTVTESMDERFPTGKQMSLSQAEEYVRQVDQEYREAELTPQAKPQPQALPPASEASRPQPNRRRRGPRPGAGRAAGGSRPANEA